MGAGRLNAGWWVLVAVAVILSVAACGDDGDDGDDGGGSSVDLCAELVDTTFEDGVDELDFYEDEAWWWTGDVVESGSWSCAANQVTWLDGSFGGELSVAENRLVITDADGGVWTSSAPLDG